MANEGRSPHFISIVLGIAVLAICAGLLLSFSKPPSPPKSNETVAGNATPTRQVATPTKTMATDTTEEPEGRLDDSRNGVVEVADGVLLKRPERLNPNVTTEDIQKKLTPLPAPESINTRPNQSAVEADKQSTRGQRQERALDEADRNYGFDRESIEQLLNN